MTEFTKEEAYSPFVRGLAIVINLIGFSFFTLIQVLAFNDNITNDQSIWLSRIFVLLMFGLSPLIVTTYFLWYLKEPNENLCGIFIVTPLAVFVHYILTGIAAHAQMFGSRTDLIIMIAELCLAIVIVVTAVRRGHIRR